MLDWIELGTPVLAIALVASVVALSAVIRSYHRRKSSEEIIVEEADPITAS